MSKISREKLLAGYVYGDIENEEYLYLPGSEIGSENPVCIFERKGLQEDIPLEAASNLVNKFNLKLVKHPVLGFKSF